MTHESTSLPPEHSRSTQAIALPPCALSLIEMLETAGFEAWCVGGFVRDALLGRPTNDIDIASSAHWTEVKNLCESHGLVVHETGTKHGTVTVVAYDEATGEPSAMEVTTFRADGTYTDSRHPASVSFVSTIEEDLARRDFTINALAYHPQRGIFDAFDGMGDLSRGIIRTVGNPERRFAEDALRILRACRFCSQLGFVIDEATLHSMTAHKGKLVKVSTERIVCELDGLLLGDNVAQAMLQTADVLCFVVPELSAMKGCTQRSKYHIYDVLEHTARTVEAAPKTRLLRWAALCHDMGKPAAAFTGPDGFEHFYAHAHVSELLTRGLCARFSFGSSFASDLQTLVIHHDDVIEPTPRSVKRALAKLRGDTQMLRALLDLKRADALTHAPQYASVELIDELERTLDKVIEGNEALTVRDLAVNGRDLMNLGFEQGPRIGKTLEALLRATIDDEAPNERKELLSIAKELL